LAVGLATELEADRELGHGGVADVLCSFVYSAVSERTTDTDPALSNRREDRIPICRLEVTVTVDGFLEDIDRVLIAVRPRWRDGQRHRNQRENGDETLDKGVSFRGEHVAYPRRTDVGRARTA